MSDNAKAAFIEDSDSKVQIDKEGNVYISTEKEVVLGTQDLDNLRVIRRALKRNDLNEKEKTET